MPIEFRVFAFERCEQQILMIAAKAYYLIGRPLLKIHEEFDDPAAIGPSIDIVTQEDKLRLSFARVTLAEFYKALQLVQASVNVTDCVTFAQRMPQTCECSRCLRKYRRLQSCSFTESGTFSKDGLKLLYFASFCLTHSAKADSIELPFLSKLTEIFGTFPGITMVK